MIGLLFVLLAADVRVEEVRSLGWRGAGVLAVLVLAGDRNEALERLFSRMPTREGRTAPPMGMEFDPERLLPWRREHFRYDGSRTTPPYDEGVRWCVFASPIEASARQIDTYHTHFPDHARALQPLDGRTIVRTR